MASPLKLTPTNQAVSQPQGQVRDALKQAAHKTGVDFQYLVDTARRESSFRPGLTVNTSSATGLFQFIEQTWLSSVKNDGARFGLAKEAAQITRQADGRYTVADPKARAEILGLRKDPELSANFAALLTRKNGDYLKNAIGREPSAGELYAAHFLGAKGAANLIQHAAKSPDGSAVDLFPAAAKANKTLFYDKAGTERSVAAVHELLLKRHSTEPLALRQPQNPEDMLASHAPKKSRVLNAEEAGFLAKHFDSGLSAFSSKDKAKDPSFAAVLGNPNNEKRALFERRDVQTAPTSPQAHAPIPSRYGRLEEDSPAAPAARNTPSAFVSDTAKSLFEPVAPEVDDADPLPTGSPLDLRAYRQR